MPTKKLIAPKLRSTLTPEAVAKAGGRSQTGVKPGGSLKRRELAPGQTERIALHLNQDLLLELKIQAATRKMSLSVAVEQALRAWLAG
jgi:hypothetical protein